MKLGENENPAVLFNKLASIRMAFSTTANKVGDDDLKMTVVLIVPNCYSETIKNIMNEKGDALTLNEVKEVMAKKYRFLVARGQIKDEENENGGHQTVLQAGDFKGKCYKCGQTGHKANDPKCPIF